MALYILLRTLTRLLENVLPSTRDQDTGSKILRQGLVTVAVVRVRLLCPTCHGENYELFGFCQWYKVASDNPTERHEKQSLSLDEDGIPQRYVYQPNDTYNSTKLYHRVP